MPPKNASKNKQQPKQQGGNRKGKGSNDDTEDFDAMLAAAVSATMANTAKNHSNNNQAKRNSGGNGATPANRCLAADEPVVPSSADHPENPYPKTESTYPRQTWPEPTVPVSKQFPAYRFPTGRDC
ncbi:hypothetical protein NXY56_002714 [Leishmania guyanensis]